MCSRNYLNFDHHDRWSKITNFTWSGLNAWISLRVPSFSMQPNNMFHNLVPMDLYDEPDTANQLRNAEVEKFGLSEGKHLIHSLDFSDCYGRATPKAKTEVRG